MPENVHIALISICLSLMIEMQKCDVSHLLPVNGSSLCRGFIVFPFLPGSLYPFSWLVLNSAHFLPFVNPMVGIPDIRLFSLY